ncbi:MAG: undecaprenyl-diphosphatase UppP [Syntrophomonadaceae bacterium]|nr:undecaprenyl-diphosphatase UppP [Syntrophomonadaceae bacterium]
MTLAEAVLLGVVQGLTEFLPVSSSGHLVIMQHFLGFQEAPLTFDILVHLGTVLAVIAAFWTEIMNIIRRPTQRLVVMILVASVPTGLIGIFFKNIFEGFFVSLTVVAIGLLVTGILIWLAEYLSFGYKTVREMTIVDALFIGTIQGVAITPGISRSGSTIAAGLFTGLDRELAAQFSFLLSIPAILGAALLECRHLIGGQIEVDLLPLIIGPLVAAITGFMATKIVINLVKKGRLSIFSYYCWIVALLILVQQIFFNGR